jgi:hypothetical protein
MINLTMRVTFEKGRQIAHLDNVDYSLFKDPMDVVEMLVKHLKIKYVSISFNNNIDRNYIVETISGKYCIAECSEHTCGLYNAFKLLKITEK